MYSVYAPTAEAADHDEALAKEFLSEAPAKWQQHRERCARMQFQSSISVVTDGKRDQHAYEYRSNERCRLAIRQPIEPEGAGIAYGTNPIYCFILKRNSPKLPWLLNRFEEGHAGDVAKEVDRWCGLLSGEVHVLTQLAGEPLHEVVGKKNFNVRKVSRIADGGRSLVEVEFDYPNSWKKGDKHPFISIQGGVLRLDPQRSWCVVSRSLNHKWVDGTGSEEFRAETKDLTSAFPVPKRTERRELRGDPNGKKRSLLTEGEFELTEPRQLPADSEFQLSAFGLPEPFATRGKQSTPTYLWLLLGAAACGLGAVGLRWYIRRRESSAP